MNKKAGKKVVTQIITCKNYPCVYICYRHISGVLILQCYNVTMFQLKMSGGWDNNIKISLIYLAFECKIQ